MTTPVDRMWDAVRSRDRSAVGLFVYAVRSTGVYCRPACPSRRPLRRHVEFFPTGAMAHAAGYRPCRRCRPDEPGHRSAGEAAVYRACHAIAAAPDASWTSARLARVTGATSTVLRRTFQRTLGLSPRDYVAACRRRCFLDVLSTTRSVSDATYAAGYGSSSRVYELGGTAVSPASYAKGGRGATISWSTARSPVGVILAAATSRGICFVAVGADVAEVAAAVRREFPHATIAQGLTPTLRTALRAATAVAEAKPFSLDVPADIAGTAFQWRVWRALTRIPCGTTRTYSDVARTIGDPKSVRAAARACATNPLALLVPCHRVVGADGALRGYRWGTAVKASLIERESSAAGPRGAV